MFTNPERYFGGDVKGKFRGQSMTVSDNRVSIIAIPTVQLYTPTPCSKYLRGGGGVASTVCTGM